MMYVISAIFLIVTIALIISITNNLTGILESWSDSAISKARLKKFRTGTKKAELETTEKMAELTAGIREKIFPKIKNLSPSLDFDRLNEINKDLKFIGWDDTFTAETYTALTFGLKIVGIVLILLGILFLLSDSMLVGIIIFVIAFLCMTYLDNDFKSQIKKKNEALYADFPEMIRIISGYLMADMPLVKAIEESIKYVSDDWKPIMSQLIVDANTKGINEALNVLRDAVDMFEVREFVALIRLTLEQGGDAKTSFAEQSEKIAAMQKDMYIIKVGKRKTLASTVQAPALLVNMVVLILPMLVTSVAGLNLNM